MTEVFWTGGSGRHYVFELHPINTPFPAGGACYIFTKSEFKDKWSAIYIGETGDLSERFDDHHKMPCIKQHKATHICVYRDNMSEKLDRLTVEEDLLAKEDPPCNE